MTWLVLVVVGVVLAVALVTVVRRREGTEAWDRRATLLTSLETERVHLGVVVDPDNPEVEIVLDCFIDDVRGSGADAVVLTSLAGAEATGPHAGAVPRELPITRIVSVAVHDGGRLRW